MRCLRITLLSLCFGAAGALVGCDRWISREESTSTDSSGATIQKDKTITQDQNGNTVTDESKAVVKPQ